MTFANVLFPNPKLIHDLERTIAAQTTIVGNGNREFRIQKQANYFTSWKYPSRAMSAQDAQAIADFIANEANFGLNSFKFKDPYYNTWADMELAYTGSGTKYYLTLKGINDTHPIFHVGGDVVVKRNGTPTTFTRVIENGVPMVEVPSAGTITISGTFYFAVRLDSAEYTQIMSGLTSSNSPYADTISDLKLIEVFEY
jgi:hypothetical protein